MGRREILKEKQTIFIGTFQFRLRIKMAPIYGHSLVTIIFVFFLLSTVYSHVQGLNYSREELYSLRLGYSDGESCTHRSWDDTFFTTGKRNDNHRDKNGGQQQRKRGRRGGHLVKSRKKFRNTPLPTIVLSNVQRLYNKTDEFFSRISNDKNFTHCQVFCFTETWLTPSHPDNLVKPNGFSIYRLDRDRVITEKEDGGGVCFIVNDKWCTNIKVTSTLCTKNLECVTIKCRPFYLPREFTSITLTGVYIHPRADTTDALNDLSNIVSKAENSEPDTVSIVLGDFY